MSSSFRNTFEVKFIDPLLLTHRHRKNKLGQGATGTIIILPLSPLLRIVVTNTNTTYYGKNVNLVKHEEKNYNCDKHV